MNERKTLKFNESGHLIIGGVKASDLAKKYGTPLYVMDKAHIINVCKAFDNALKSEYGDGMIAYASKAFSCKEIYRIVNSVGIGCDVVSGGELYTAQSVDFPSEKIIFHGNNKTIEELKYALECKVKYVVIDSLSEAEDLDFICQNKGIVQDVLIRVNPGVEAHTHHYIQTAKIDSKFGFAIADGSAVTAVKKVSSYKNLNLVGLHCHIGSQIFERKSFSIAVDKMTDFYKQIRDSLGLEFSVLNLGGGFGIYYTDEDKKYTVEDYTDYVVNIARELKKAIDSKGIKKPYLILEPGRSIVGEAGITLYTVGRIKEIKGIKNYLSIDGGMFDNPRFALYQAKYSVVPVDKGLEKPSKVYTLAGKCCESGDIIAEDCNLPVMTSGDIVAVLSTGAYNYSMASNYNRNRIPAVVMVEDGKDYLAVKPQTFDDVIRNDL
ncbi:MAG: diaminopimelate decarboxylase [Clostridia bacterium]|nr:diaminopimelate decarboxylase [Clostridia bacterium]